MTDRAHRSASPVPHRPPKPAARLAALARLVDEVLADRPGNQVVRCSDDPSAHGPTELRPTDRGTTRPDTAGPDVVGLGTASPDTASVDTVSVDTVELGSGHPLSVLLGWSAPASVDVVGVRAAGTAHRLAPAGTTSAVLATVLVDRTGAVAGILRRGDEVERLEDGEGLVLDACRRSLGLPTSAPPSSTAHLWCAVWIDRLLARAAAGWARATWAGAAALHPVLDGERRPDSPLPHPRQLAHRVVDHALRYPWSALRRAPRRTGLGQRAPERSLAAWMDDGAFARWVLSGLPDRADAQAALEGLLPRGLLDAIDTVLTEVDACAPDPR